jgi:hypothetical protein
MIQKNLQPPSSELKGKPSKKSARSKHSSTCYLLGSLFDLKVAELHSSKTSIKLQGIISQNITLFKLPFVTHYIVNINLKCINHKKIPTALTPSLVQSREWSTYISISKINYQNIFIHNGLKHKLTPRHLAIRQTHSPN